MKTYSAGKNKHNNVTTKFYCLLAWYKCCSRTNRYYFTFQIMFTKSQTDRVAHAIIIESNPHQSQLRVQDHT